MNSSLNAHQVCPKFCRAPKILNFWPFSHESVRCGICQPIRTLRSPEAPRGRARAPPGARGEAMRVYPGRGAPRFASARRRGAGEVARRGVYVTFLAHGYSCATRAVFLTRHSRARRRALMTRGTRAGRSARNARCAASIATFAAIIRVDLARRARRSRRDRGRDFFGAYGSLMLKYQAPNLI